MPICSVVDISDFLTEEIKGPATFSCKSGAGCKFEEPAMNGLIDSIFGDPYITLQCEGGECLHYSQVPGYVVSEQILATLIVIECMDHKFVATSETR
jgi:hypothetical protein